MSVCVFFTERDVVRVWCFRVCGFLQKLREKRAGMEWENVESKETRWVCLLLMVKLLFLSFIRWNAQKKRKRKMDLRLSPPSIVRDNRWKQLMVRVLAFEKDEW